MTARPIIHESHRRPVYAAIALALMMVAVLLAEGCVGQGSGGTENKISTLEPQQMVLQVSDLPDGYTLKEEKQINTSQLDPSVWNAKKGYEVVFTKDSHATVDVISETIVLEPLNKISQQIPILTEYYAKDGAKTVQLPGPVIGEASSAFIMPGRADLGPERYVIMFIKKDVFVFLVMSGGNPNPDYAVLRSVAVKAAGKIQ